MYCIEELGKIVILKNLVFPDSNSGKMQIDPAYKRGRLCIYIGEKEESYFVPITSKKIEPSSRKYHFSILPNHVKYGTLCFDRSSFANTRIIVKKPLFGLYEIDQLNPVAYYQFLCQILNNDVITTPDTFAEMKDVLEEQRKEFEKNYTYQKKM